MARKAAIHWLAVFLAAASAARAQSTRPADGRLNFGTDGLAIPNTTVVNGHSARTAQLLGEALRHEALEWKRAQLAAELGLVGLPDAAPYLVEAMKDSSPTVRAAAARSAGMIPNAALVADVEKLLADVDPSVRCQALRSTASLARSQSASTDAIKRALSDPDPQVVAVALQVAWTRADAHAITDKLPTLPNDLKSQAALALGRLDAKDQSAALLPLLDGDVPQRSSALWALSQIGSPENAAAVLNKLADAHPTVRRQAVLAMIKLVPPPICQSRAMEMLHDPDATVRQAAAQALTPVPSADALTALFSQLDQPYMPLHTALRQALVHPDNDTVRRLTIQRAAELLSSDNPRRREDASFVLGHLHSNVAIDAHIALLRWDAGHPQQADWPLIAQAAESLGLIGDPRAGEPLMGLINPAPDALEALQRPQRDAMADAMANALVSAAYLGHQPALPQAVRILALDPSGIPGHLRAGSAFAVGLLSPTGHVPDEINFMSLYASDFESHAAKFESLKALGNLRYAPPAAKLKKISETDTTPDLRWIAHWAYERITSSHIPYTPPSGRREPPVTISDLKSIE